MNGRRHCARFYCHMVACLLALLLHVGCREESSQRQAGPPRAAHDSDHPLHSETSFVSPISDQELPMQVAAVPVGEWDFDPDALRKTSEYQQQIELLESRGYLHEDALERAESKFALMSSIKYVFTSDTITVHTPSGVISQKYRVLTQGADTVVIQPEKSESVGKHTSIRVIDPNHIVVSDDSRPDIPVWTFKRSSNQSEW